MSMFAAAQRARRPTTAPPSVARALRSRSEPLPRTAAQTVGRRLGRDLSRVRVHHGAQASAAAAAIGADAFTVGRHIVFGADRYRPESSGGGALLEHELIHVVQQDRAHAAIPASLPMGRPGDRWEHEARSGARGEQITPAPIQVAGSWWEEKKAAFYKSVIEGTRTARGATVALMRTAIRLAPEEIQPVLNGIVSVFEQVSAVLDEFALAIIAIVVGFGEGVVDLVRGILSLLSGAWQALWALVADAWNRDGFHRSIEFWTGLWHRLSELPRSLKARCDAWLARFEKASPEMSGVMVVELTGQILALIASFAVGGAAGAAARGGSAAAEVADVAEAVTVIGDAAKPAAVLGDAAKPATALGDAAKPAAAVSDAAKPAAAVSDAAKPAAAVSDAAKPAAAVRPPLRAIQGGKAGPVRVTRPKLPGSRPTVAAPAPARPALGAGAYEGRAARQLAHLPAPAPPRPVPQLVRPPQPITGVAPQTLPHTPAPMHVPVEIPKAPPVPAPGVPRPVTPPPTPIAPVAPNAIPRPLMTGAVGLLAEATTASKPVSVPTPDPMTDPEERRRRGRPVRLVLPAGKSGRAQVAEYVRKRRLLVHDPSYDRERNAQASRWDAGVKPGGHGGHGTEGMSFETYWLGLHLRLTEARIFRPDWTHLGNPLSGGHQVDHLIELQVLSETDAEVWGDTFLNYELLDAKTNASSGSQLRANIARERRELDAFYNDSAWLKAILHFDEIVPTGSGAGHRWGKEEIQAGVHLQALQGRTRGRGRGR